MKQNIAIKLVEDRPVIYNPISNTRAEIDKESLARVILSINTNQELNSALRKSGFIEENTDDNYADDIEHWIKRNWLHSLKYYLSTRTDHLEDRGEQFEANQINVLSQYIESDGLPPNFRKKNGRSIELGKGLTPPDRSIAQVLNKRTSVRSCPKRRLSLAEVSSILYNGTHLLRENRKKTIEDNILNAVDSFGAAFDIYLCVYDVEGLESGIYFYDLQSTHLENIKYVEQHLLREQMYKAQTEQIIAHNASYAIMLVAHFERYQWRYRHEAALQHIFINAGQIMHPFILIATQFSHATHISPAINDSLMNKILDHDASEFQTVYVLSAG